MAKAFERETGRPVFLIEYRKVPTKGVDGEQVADTQPIPQLPPPVARQTLTEAMLTKRTPTAHAAVLERFRQLTSTGQFEPPNLQGVIVFPGFDGGPGWGGAAFDPESRLLFVNASEVPCIAKLVERPIFITTSASCSSDRNARAKQAAQAFQRRLQLNPYYAEAHHNYAVLIEAEGKLDEAAQHYRKAIENKPGYRSAHFYLGRILVNQDRLAEAIEHFQQTLTPEDEETPRYLYALGATCIRAGQRPKGIQYLREALKKAQTFKQSQLVASLERDLKLLEQSQ